MVEQVLFQCCWGHRYGRGLGFGMGLMVGQVGSFLGNCVLLHVKYFTVLLCANPILLSMFCCIGGKGASPCNPIVVPPGDEVNKNAPQIAPSVTVVNSVPYPPSSSAHRRTWSAALGNQCQLDAYERAYPTSGGFDPLFPTTACKKKNLRKL